MDSTVKHQKAIESLGMKTNFHTTYSELRRIERDAFSQVTGENPNASMTEKDEKEILDRVSNLFKKMPSGVFINHNYRGEALLVKKENVVEGMYTHPLGYGILAPDLTSEANQTIRGKVKK